MNFVFLSRDGGIIQPVQESGILAWKETIEHEWTHHTFTAVIKRRHIVIALKAEEITVLLQLRVQFTRRSSV